jgi:hypothetical protein
MNEADIKKWKFEVNAALHRLWTKAVGTDDYDKEEWKRLEALIYERRNENE